MRVLFLIAVLLGWLQLPAAAQNAKPRTPEDFGYRHQVVMFGKDSVNVLVKAKKGEELVRKPLLLWLQGSLPQPLILYDKQGPYSVFPFAGKAGLDSLAATCHLAIIGKPGIPLMADVEGRDPNKMFSQGGLTPYYCERNHLEYYARREEAVLRYLKKQPWVDKARVLVGGHSQGSAVVARLAAVPGLVSHAVYLSGSPLGRALTEVARDPNDTESTAADAEAGFAKWQRGVDSPTQSDCRQYADSNKNVYSFGESLLPFLLAARVPVFIGYGTRDHAAVANDYLRLETMRLHKANFTFRAYPGREHNFFGFKDGQINYDDWYWDKVGRDFLHWAGIMK
ncbi:alpha/beta hydrolase family protein [Hymenobacter arizonensis]|uniref:Alpha/beta hydrolase family protein n=1 Tax=Hymenobacter arizonensis TaxID=1227077 RepID=A0A1I5SFP5_HYMAR|nr:acyl-CoA thioester hydrolase/BAAT C-terminal domain-containing protein [Hymenobacter arizonensis]SFP69553.1 Alpha/beta hydrolase family protein [Hymenobacter arizonensis]